MIDGSDPRRWSVADVALRLAGGVVTLAATLLVGVLMFITVPWRVSTFLGVLRAPVAVVIVVGGLAALFWYAPRATGTRWGALLPLAGWSVIAMLGLGAGDPGGALLMANDWVSGQCLFGGTVVAVIGTVLALRPRPGPPEMPGPPDLPGSSSELPGSSSELPGPPPGGRRVPWRRHRVPPDRPVGGSTYDW